jgi:hypothetical protein
MKKEEEKGEGHGKFYLVWSFKPNLASLYEKKSN